MAEERRPTPDSCAAHCRAVAEPLAASAPAAFRHWLCLELPPPWPADAWDALGATPLHAILRQWQAAKLGLRLQLLRGGNSKTAPQAPPALWWATTTQPGATLWSLPATAVTALAALPLETLSQNQGPAHWGSTVQATPLSTPRILVCTHARRDPCCARLGLPLFQALHAHAPDWVWQTSHLGGHRFAPVVQLLPSSVTLGQLRTADAAAWLRALEAGRMHDLHNYRGRAGQPAPVQAADAALRRQHGIDAIDAVVWRGEWQAHESHTDVTLWIEREAWHARLLQHPSSALRPASCGAAASPWTNWKVQLTRL
ncbi:MAG: sucrase ferredoxin [Polyangiales bacterium]